MIVLQYDPNDEESSAKLFSVPDFIGFASSQIGKIYKCVNYG